MSQGSAYAFNSLLIAIRNVQPFQGCYLLQSQFVSVALVFWCLIFQVHCLYRLLKVITKQIIICGGQILALHIGSPLLKPLVSVTLPVLKRSGNVCIASLLSDIIPFIYLNNVKDKAVLSSCTSHV